MDTPARLLRLLAMLSSRGSWSGSELAERLEVTERSIRRDITRLRDLGYPISSTTGVHGGYSSAAGGPLPPLLLDDDEAVSMAVALHDLANRSTDAIAESALRALTKLGQVMPASLRERVSALSTVVVGGGAASDPFGNVATPWSRSAATPIGSPDIWRARRWSTKWSSPLPCATNCVCWDFACWSRTAHRTASRTAERRQSSSLPVVTRSRCAAFSTARRAWASLRSSSGRPRPAADASRNRSKLRSSRSATI